MISQLPKKRLLALLAPVLLVSVAIAAGDRIVIADFSGGIDARGVPAGWQLKEKSGKAEFGVVQDGDLHALRLRSADTSYSIQKSVDLDVKQHPILTWKWKVTKLPAGGDFRKSKTDDQAAQLFLAFSKTKAIVYIWDTSAPQGLMKDAPAPPFMRIKAVVVRSGPAETGKWISEKRNVYDDYRKLYGQDPPPIQGVRLQINSQHTETSAESYFADVALEKAGMKQ
ncbi:MAG: hypothetical protein A2X56_15115 [Nitrospirae bacterium GWC2_57_13]|jgi:hypothetical protein|nr:MAG: hypothetical protein A2072_03190 [Nitrospirae bacterium GWC1_57_7]OGW28039.1 MAG: hypothetical protein A2X56_15115 [Nitrospirae bacterium GWC2_57_13]OGW41042.1 MAG: hypothetical protein A2X57_10605 [Nitrospirae bacterium GWD2_57_8]HAS53790.1 hypothetical protein [Nitrospiraceae bacterium]